MNQTPRIFIKQKYLGSRPDANGISILVQVKPFVESMNELAYVEVALVQNHMTHNSIQYGIEINRRSMLSDLVDVMSSIQHALQTDLHLNVIAVDTTHDDYVELDLHALLRDNTANIIEKAVFRPERKSKSNYPAFKLTNMLCNRYWTFEADEFRLVIIKTVHDLVEKPYLAIMEDAHDPMSDKNTLMSADEIYETYGIEI